MDSREADCSLPWMCDIWREVQQDTSHKSRKGRGKGMITAHSISASRLNSYQDFGSGPGRCTGNMREGADRALFKATT